MRTCRAHEDEDGYEYEGAYEHAHAPHEDGYDYEGVRVFVFMIMRGLVTRPLRWLVTPPLLP